MHSLLTNAMEILSDYLASEAGKSFMSCIITIFATGIFSWISIHLLNALKSSWESQRPAPQEDFRMPRRFSGRLLSDGKIEEDRQKKIPDVLLELSAIEDVNGYGMLSNYDPDVLILKYIPNPEGNGRNSSVTSSFPHCSMQMDNMQAGSPSDSGARKEERPHQDDLASEAQVSGEQTVFSIGEWEKDKPVDESCGKCGHRATYKLGDYAIAQVLSGMTGVAVLIILQSFEELDWKTEVFIPILMPWLMYSFTFLGCAIVGDMFYAFGTRPYALGARCTNAEVHPQCRNNLQQSVQGDWLVGSLMILSFTMVLLLNPLFYPMLRTGQ